MYGWIIVYRILTMGDKIVSAQMTAKPVKTRFGEFKAQ